MALTLKVTLEAAQTNIDITTETLIAMVAVVAMNIATMALLTNLTQATAALITITTVLAIHTIATPNRQEAGSFRTRQKNPKPILLGIFAGSFSIYFLEALQLLACSDFTNPRGTPIIIINQLLSHKTSVDVKNRYCFRY